MDTACGEAFLARSHSNPELFGVRIRLNTLAEGDHLEKRGLAFPGLWRVKGGAGCDRHMEGHWSW